MTRILIPSYLLGKRTLLVDSQGEGDFSAIQQALNHAALYATASQRWSVRVAPGEYAENLALKDYVDLHGLGPGRAALVKPASGAAIASAASCTVANLALEAPVTVIQVGAGFSGALTLDNVIVDQSALDTAPLSVSGGAVEVYRSRLASGGGVRLQGGALQLHQSELRNQAASDGGYNYVLNVEGGLLALYGCLLENTSPAGYCLAIDDYADDLRAYHTIFRRKDSTYALDTSVTQDMVLAGCLANADHSPGLTGYHDLIVDTSL